MSDRPFSRDDWKQLGRLARRRSLHMGGYYDEGVRCVHVWAGPDNHPDNWQSDWAFFHGDKGLYPEKRAFIGWVAAAGWSQEGDDGFDHFEIRTRNIQALKAHRDDTDWQTTEVRSQLINRPEDVEWVRSMFLKLFREAFPDREEPEITVSDAAFDVPEDFPSYLQPAAHRED